MPQISEALVMAASRLSNLDSKGTPKTLITIGERPLIHHVLQGLKAVGITRTVITLGYQGEKVKKYLEENNVFPEMKIEYLVLPESVWAVRGHSVSTLVTKELFDNPFLLVTSDHLFNPELLRRMTCLAFDDVEAYTLVETDVKGMVGLPTSAVQVDFDTETMLVKSIGSTLNEKYLSLDAGLFAVTKSIFSYLEKLSEDRLYFTLAEALQLMANENKLRAITTSELEWFAVETPDSLLYAMEEHDKYDATSWFRRQSVKRKADLIMSENDIEIVGSARKKVNIHNGGEWSEFTVEKWRSAVYTTNSYFKELYDDTTKFCTNALKQIGGKEESILIEVGCGTGEFCYPQTEHAKYVVGIDINPDFIKWCQKNTPKNMQDRLFFLLGDAQKLSDLMKEELPSHVCHGHRRVVACIGNTLGIIPDGVRDKVIEGMAQAAGPDGRLVIVFWSSESFPDAIKNFYGKNPQLCGKFDPEKHVDWKECRLRTPSGYSTHWWSVEEAKQILKKHNIPEISVERKGRGVLVLAKGKQQDQMMSDFFDRYLN